SLLILLLPASFGHTRNFAAHGDLTDLVTGQSEFTEGTARATSQCATVALTGRICIARQLLQLQTGLITLVVRLGLVFNDCLQLGALASVFLNQVGALLFTVDQCQFCHGSLSF